jgi:Helix-turn-helix of DDE superfamily endonuclease/DDE superfamily endonuclease
MLGIIIIPGDTIIIEEGEKFALVLLKTLFVVDIIGDSVYLLYANLCNPPRQTARVSGRDRTDAQRVCACAAGLCGGGAKGVLSQMEDKLLFILVYQKTNPLQTMHGLQFDLSQPQTHYWMHRLLPVLRQALATLGMAPERDASRVATSPLMLEGAPAGAVDGTERRRQRPTDAAKQRAYYSGKKKAHTDKNVLLINEYTSKVIYLSPTVAGKTHDKKATDEADLLYPVNSTLDKDTGFQGYEPAGVLTHQPKKNPEARS